MTLASSAQRQRRSETPFTAADIWLARGAVLLIVALQLLLVNDLGILLRWVMPLGELALLLPLSIATA
jgi:hypothetical protein